MSTLSNQQEDLQKTNYCLSFKLMKNIVDTLYMTTENSVDNLDYSPELIMIFNNLHNINIKLDLI